MHVCVAMHRTAYRCQDDIIQRCGRGDGTQRPSHRLRVHGADCWSLVGWCCRGSNGVRACAQTSTPVAAPDFGASAGAGSPPSAPLETSSPYRVLNALTSFNLSVSCRFSVSVNCGEKHSGCQPPVFFSTTDTVPSPRRRRFKRSRNRRRRQTWGRRRRRQSRQRRRRPKRVMGRPTPRRQCRSRRAWHTLRQRGGPNDKSSARTQTQRACLVEQRGN